MKTDCTTSVCGSATAVMVEPQKNSFELLPFFAAALVLCSHQQEPLGAWLTDRLGDLSYGVYIFAFPVRQIVVQLGRDHSCNFTIQLSLSFLVTSLLAYASWHVLERPALRFRPKRMVLA